MQTTYLTDLEDRRMEQMDQLDKTIENKCKPCSSNFGQGECEGCPSLNKLEKIGEELMQISKERRNFLDIKSSNESRKASREPLNLTVAMYINFKQKGMKDSEIAIALECSRNKLAVFKKDHGITNTRSLKKS